MYLWFCRNPQKVLLRFCLGVFSIVKNPFNYAILPIFCAKKGSILLLFVFCKSTKIAWSSWLWTLWKDAQILNFWAKDKKLRQYGACVGSAYVHFVLFYQDEENVLSPKTMQKLLLLVLPKESGNGRKIFLRKYSTL